MMVLTALLWNMTVTQYYALTGLMFGTRVTQYCVLTGLVFSMRVIPLSSMKSCATRDTDFSTIRISGSSAAIRATQLRRNSCSYMAPKTKNNNENIFHLGRDVNTREGNVFSLFICSQGWGYHLVSGP